MSAVEWELRRDLAAALRWAARLDLHEAVANHFSAAIGDGAFLLNPGGRHFSRIRASDLLRVDIENPRSDGVDPTALCLHAGLHRRLPRARCVLHAHPQYATALASLADWKMRPIDQNACRFYNRVSYDDGFGGMLLAESEADRIAAALGDKRVLLMRGHGVLVVDSTIGAAFDSLFYFERACRNQWLALAAGAPLNAIPPDVAEKTARQWGEYPGAENHLAELREILRREEPDFLE